MSDASLDVLVLRALVGEARLSLDSARLLLDEARASAADLDAGPLRELWAVLEERIRQRREVDTQSMLARVKVPAERALWASVLAHPEMGVLPERLTLLRDRAIRAKALDALRAAAKAIQAGAGLASCAESVRGVLPVLDGAKGRVRETHGDTWKIIDEASIVSSGGRRSLPTGWHDLDAAWRLIPSLHVVGAQPGVGKSALVAGLVRQWTRAKTKVGVLAYEDDAVDMQRRILACDACVSLAQMGGDAPVSTDEQNAVSDASKARQALEQYLLADDTPSPTIEDAIASAREMHARGCRIVVLDNMTCVRLDKGERHEELEAALIRLRDLAQKELKIPILVIGHLKRGQSDGDELTKRPKLTDFAGAAAWERACRSALGLWWENNEVRMRMLKQTNAPSGGEWTLELRQSSATVVGARKFEEAEVSLKVTTTRRYDR